MFLKVIACEIAQREMCYVAAQSPHLTDLEFVTQGHHDVPAAGREDLQRRIDAVPAGKFDAILLGYGLCSNMLLGLTSKNCQMVIPKAHDCITFFLGSKERYQQHFNDNPGTYYYTSGWLECAQRRGLASNEAGSVFMPATTAAGFRATFDELAKKYGEDEARYLMEVMGSWSNGYTRGALIEFDFNKCVGYDQQVREICQQRGWKYECVSGDLSLLQKALNGDWNTNDFLILKPGETVMATYDDQVMAAKPT